MMPAYAALLPKLVSPNTSPSLATAPGAHHYKLMFLEFPPTNPSYYDIVTLGDGSRSEEHTSELQSPC